MEIKDNTPRHWYKKKRYIATAIVIGLFTISNLGSDSTTNTKSGTQVASPIVSQPINNSAVPLQANEIQKSSEKQLPVNESGLSNNNYYTNTAGNKVHSPTYSDSVPRGASAKCRDGTYSFSQSRRGTCSHHGGVASWIN